MHASTYCNVTKGLKQTDSTLENQFYSLQHRDYIWHMTAELLIMWPSRITCRKHKNFRISPSIVRDCILHKLHHNFATIQGSLRWRNRSKDGNVLHQPVGQTWFALTVTEFVVAASATVLHPRFKSSLAGSILPKECRYCCSIYFMIP